MQLFCSRRRFLLEVMQLISKLDVRVNLAKPSAQQSTKFVLSALSCRQRLRSSMHVVSSCSCKEQASMFSSQIRSYVAQLSKRDNWQTYAQPQHEPDHPLQ